MTEMPIPQAPPPPPPPTSETDTGLSMGASDQSVIIVGAALLIAGAMIALWLF